jgi:hypothetical protein
MQQPKNQAVAIEIKSAITKSSPYPHALFRIVHNSQDTELAKESIY